MSNIKHTQNPIGSLEKFFDLLLITLIVLMTLKGGTSGACAACKYQRRRCAADCPLAPYFPAEQPKVFQNVHRLFGVRSIVKILENLDEAQKPEAMKSIIFQSYVRERSPVHGCLGVTQQLQYMIWLAEEELKAVNSQLQLYRSQQNHNQMINEIAEKQSQLDLGMGLTVNQSNVTPFFSPLPVSETQQQQPPQPQTSYTYSCSEVNNNAYISTDYCKEIMNRYPYNDNNGFSNQNESCNKIKISNQQEEDDDHEYDEIHQFLELIDDRQSFAVSKEAYGSSSGESLKEPIDEIGENELKSAATCFSLTGL